MSESNQVLTQQYYDRTQSALAALSAQIASSKEAGTTKDGIDGLLVEVARLRKELTEAISFLPGYDYRQFDLQIKKFEQETESMRSSVAPKAKFAFKRKATSKPTSASLTPTISQPTPPQTSSPSDTKGPAPITGLTLSGYSNSFLTASSLSTPWTTSSDLTISDLDRCIVNLLPSPSQEHPDVPSGNNTTTGSRHFTALHARNLSNTVLILPAITGSALLHDVRNCIIALGSHQFRMHTSQQVDIYISIGSDPIIEHCTGIRFADYPAILRRTSGLQEAEATESKYLAVQDFSHIRATPSPNWSTLPAEEAVKDADWPLSPEHVAEVLTHMLPAL